MEPSPFLMRFRWSTSSGASSTARSAPGKRLRLAAQFGTLALFEDPAESEIDFSILMAMDSRHENDPPLIVHWVGEEKPQACKQLKHGTPEWIRTTDLLLRRSRNCLQQLHAVPWFSTIWGVCFRSANKPNCINWMGY
jgi:hypothetical protein